VRNGSYKAIKRVTSFANLTENLFLTEFPVLLKDGDLIGYSLEKDLKYENWQTKEDQEVKKMFML
jgi:hypothetical protein